MRIAGHIDHPVMKITLLQLNNRYAVKFESGLYELVYQFREGSGVEGVDALKELIDPGFQESVFQQLQQMHQLKMRKLSEQFSDSGESFEEII